MLPSNAPKAPKIASLFKNKSARFGLFDDQIFGENDGCALRSFREADASTLDDVDGQSAA